MGEILQRQRLNFLSFRFPILILGTANSNDGTPLMSSDTIRTRTLQELAKAQSKPSLLPLHGQGKRGFFPYPGQKTPWSTEAAQLALAQGWIEDSGQVFTGGGKSKGKPLYRLTSAGLSAVLLETGPVKILSDMRNELEQFRSRTRDIGERLTAMELGIQAALQQQLAEMTAPDAPARDPVPGQRATTAAWASEALTYLEDWQRRHPGLYCSLAELYEHVVKPKGVPIGAYHDGIRGLAKAQKVRLHTFGRGLEFLEGSDVAIVMMKEIKDRVEAL